MIKTISAFPFYGGKAKMASLICDMLDYEHTDIYIEPFGGGARTLLNKPRHAVEIYNDSSAGLVSIFEILSNPDTAMDFISELYKTEYSYECFDRALNLRNSYEDNFLKETKRLFNCFLRRLENKYSVDCFGDLIHSIRGNHEDITAEISKALSICRISQEEKELLDYYSQTYKTLIEAYIRAYRDYMSGLATYNETTKKWKMNKSVTEEDYKTTLQDIEMDCGDEPPEYDKVDLKSFKKAILPLIKQKALDKANEAVANRPSDLNNRDTKIKLAVATFVLQIQSRDGAGKSFSENKFKTNDEYYNYIDRLYDVAQRLNGVTVSQCDAMEYLRDFSDDIVEGLSEKEIESIKSFDNLNDTEKETIGAKRNAIMQAMGYINNSRVMMYLDPTYLQQKDSAKETEDNKDSRQSKSENNNVSKQSKNVGSVYKQSWDQKHHEEFLHVIRDAECHIVLSNYDDPNNIYNDILVNGNPDKTRWKRLEFETKTSVSNNPDDKDRTEVLWYNY